MTYSFGAKILPPANSRTPALGFPVQHGLDLLRHDRSAEHPREGVAHGRLKLALDAVNETHLIACLTRRRPSFLVTCPVTRVSRDHTCHIAWYRDTRSAAGPTEL